MKKNITILMPLLFVFNLSLGNKIDTINIGKRIIFKSGANIDGYFKNISQVEVDSSFVSLYSQAYDNDITKKSYESIILRTLIENSKARIEVPFMWGSDTLIFVRYVYSGLDYSKFSKSPITYLNSLSEMQDTYSFIYNLTKKEIDCIFRNYTPISIYELLDNFDEEIVVVNISIVSKDIFTIDCNYSMDSDKSPSRILYRSDNNYSLFLKKENNYIFKLTNSIKNEVLIVFDKINSEKEIDWSLEINNEMRKMNVSKIIYVPSKNGKTIIPK